MKRFGRLTFFMSLVALAAVVSGCGVSPQRQFVFSPDGTKIAYVNYPNIGSGEDVFDGSRVNNKVKAIQIGKAMLKTGITVKDLNSGAAKQIYEAKPHFVVHAVFWPDKSKEIYFLESNYYIALSKDLDKFIFNFKKIDPETGEITYLKSKKVSANSYRLSDEDATILFINFDAETGILTAGSKIWTIGEKKSALDTIISEYTHRLKDKRVNTGDFTLSPDRKQMSFVEFSEAGNAEIKVMDLTLLDVKTVYSAECLKQAYCVFMMNGVRWSPDGRYIYFTKNYKEMNRLMRYDTTTGVTKKMSNEEIISFDVFPDGNRLLVLSKREDKGYLSVTDSEGNTEKTGEVIFPGYIDTEEGNAKQNKSFAFANLKIAPDGRHAAAAGITTRQDINPLVVYDLDTLSGSIFAETENENLVAGLFHVFYKRYEEAVGCFKQAGVSGSIFLSPLLSKLGRNEDAAAEMERAFGLIRDQGDDVDVHYALARIYDNIGGFYKDVAKGEYGLVKGKNKGKAFYYLGELSSDDEKIEWLKKSIDEFRMQGCLESPTILCAGDMELISGLPLRLAEMYMGQNTKAGKAAALRTLEQAEKFPLTMFWHSLEVHYKLGSAYESAGNCGKALASYKAFISEYTTDVEDLEKAYEEWIKLSPELKKDFEKEMLEPIKAMGSVDKRTCRQNKKQ